jgi:hypothetical protein
LTRGRWKEPSSRSGREEYRALRAELRRRTSPRRRSEIETRLDEICAVGSLSESGSSAEHAEVSLAVTHTPKLGMRSAIELDRTRARLWPLLSARTITPETIVFATECAAFTRNLFDKKWSDLSPVQQAGMVAFQFDAWAGTKSTPETLAVLDEVHGTGHLK